MLDNINIMIYNIIRKRKKKERKFINEKNKFKQNKRNL